ncbi:PAS domain-containing sensor histidine kinase [Emcibacter sp.]|uniref:sensor histidine kinase n=1 Tax=Emcibacter sp. TaxID=1979954 RepID=UPI002AA6C8CD|nr:PAS domain-containing sensor histidine kinase [Emcibacter sp.]
MDEDHKREVRSSSELLDMQAETEFLKVRIDALRKRIASVPSCTKLSEESLKLEQLEQQRKSLCPLIEGQQDFFRLIVEEVTDVVVLSDQAANILYVNPVIEQLLGYKPEEVLGQNVKILMQGADQKQHDEYVTSYIDSGFPRIIGIGRDVVCRHKSGEPMPFELRITETVLQGRRYFIGTLRDIHRRKKAEEKAARATLEAVTANKAKSDFLANMSHELRTPLNAIIGYSEMLQKQFFGDIGHEKYLEYASYIQLSGNRLLNLVNDVLDISKIEAGRYELTRDYVDFEEVINEVFHEFIPMAESENVQLVVVNEDKIGRIYVDEKALKQILSNLISNAIKFSFPDKEVRLILQREQDDCLSIVVEDQGVGMSDDEIKIALSSFGQVQSSQVRNHQGTGLGLPLCRHLVELHGGDFSLDSTPGKGTRIRVVLPVHKDKELF